MKSAILILFVAFITASCGLKPLTAEEIVAKAVEHSGVKALKKATVTFRFRTFDYLYRKTEGAFVYQRTFETEGNDTIVDKYDGQKVLRTQNGKSQATDKKQALTIQNSLNSVIYFAFLPLQLTDPAVNFKTIGVDRIKGIDYFMVQVTFDKHGGGEDHDDVFMYWFHCETFAMDYLAYKYNTNGGGIRFRSAKNKRKINGVHFQDYDNYAPRKGLYIPLKSIGKSYNKGVLKKLSEIELEQVTVERL